MVSYNGRHEEIEYPSHLTDVDDCTVVVRSFPRFTASDDNDVHTQC